MNKCVNRSLCAGMVVLVLWVVYYSFESYTILMVKEKLFQITREINNQTSDPHHWRGCPVPDSGVDGMIVVPSFHGRLGNQIFEYLSGWAIAKHYGMWAAVPNSSLYELNLVFEGLSVPSIEELDARCDLPIVEGYENHSKTSWSRKIFLHHIENPDPGLTFLRLPVYVVVTEELLPWWRQAKTEFKFKDEFRLAAHQRLLQISQQFTKSQTTQAPTHNESRETSLEFVGVHVRRTDYMNHLVHNYPGAHVVDERFFLNAMKWLRERLKRPLAFVVASDDVTWCREHLAKSPDVFMADTGNGTTPAFDLAVLGSCNHTIFAYGTFGLSAAMLANGRYTLLYDTQNGTNTKEMEFATFLPGWHILDDEGHSHYDAAQIDFKLTYVKG